GERRDQDLVPLPDAEGGEHEVEARRAGRGGDRVLGLLVFCQRGFKPRDPRPLGYPARAEDLDDGFLFGLVEAGLRHWNFHDRPCCWASRHSISRRSPSVSSVVASNPRSRLAFVALPIRYVTKLWPAGSYLIGSGDSLSRSSSSTNSRTVVPTLRPTL